MNKYFSKVLKRFEEYISEYSFQKFIIEKQEVVYLIEDSIIEYFSVRGENYGRIVIEEIFNEGVHNLKLKKFENQPEGAILQYFPYYGGLGVSNPFMKSQFEKVNQLLPELRIRERFDNWPGFSVPHLVFELEDEGIVGYAICQTNARQTIKKVIDIGSDLMSACLSAPDFDMMYKEYGKKYVSCGLNYYFQIDRNMKDIMLCRLKADTSSWRKKNLSGGRLGLEEKGLKYFWINARIKYPDERFDGKIIEDIKSGVYEDVDKYEYVLPENKWKSEQLVYEIVKQLYSKAAVWYQFRPDFLNTGTGQLSYDIFIGKLRVAIEYQGKQHFEPVDIFGGQESFERQKTRDALKRKLSEENGVKLVYINYWDDITPELIKERIEGET